MRNTLIALLLGLTATLGFAAEEVPPHPYVEIVTTEGTIILELDGRQAPLTVGHFLALVDAGFYDGVIFHRVIPGFMAQSGGYTPDLTLKEDKTMIPNESGNGLSNVRGTIAMARTSNPHSANSQFFINVGDNSPPRPWQETVGRYLGIHCFWSCHRGYGCCGQDDQCPDRTAGRIQTGCSGGTYRHQENVPLHLRVSRMTTLFISDLHLEADRPDIGDQFINFLKTDVMEADDLYILGDLFEAWVGDDDPNTHYSKIKMAIRKVVDKGIPVYFMARQS